MIVVDVGAMAHNGDESIRPLIDRFQPDILYAFDAHPGFEEGTQWFSDTLVVARRLAAWTFFGQAAFVVDGITSGVSGEEMLIGERHYAASFALAEWLWTFPAGLVVLKLDCEGAEYPLLNAIRGQDLDERLARVLVEWHTPEMSHGLWAARPDLRCPVEEWA